MPFLIVHSFVNYWGMFNAHRLKHYVVHFGCPHQLTDHTSSQILQCVFVL